MQADQSTLAIIRSSPLFKPLAQEQLDKLLKFAKSYSLSEGEYLFHQGDLFHEIYLSLEGSMKLFRLTPNGDEKVMDIIGPGCSFAEAVMFMGGAKYPVHAVALRKSRVIGVNSKRYMDTLRASSELCFNLMGVMSQRIHWLLNEVDRLTLHNASFRLISFLLETCGGQPEQDRIHCNMPARQQQASMHTEVKLCAPKQVIASRLSIRPETLSRILKQLSTQGLIKVHDQHIELVDEPALKAIVNTEI